MTRKKRTDKIFFRYYEIPRDSYVLALFRGRVEPEIWFRKESLHFITIWRWVTVIKEGVIKLENGDYPYFPPDLYDDPENCPHSTFGDQGDQFLGISLLMEHFLADLYPG